MIELVRTEMTFFINTERFKNRNRHERSGIGSNVNGTQPCHTQSALEIKDGELTFREIELYRRLLHRDYPTPPG